MNKTLEATLGAACLATSLAATAQSNVTVYGWMDLGVQHVNASNGSLYQVVSGGRSGSRLGFRGSEDLGGGLSAVFVLEQGINLDTGTLGQSNRAFGRQSYVGLQGRWGTLVFGRVAMFSGATGSFDMFQEVDPFIDSFGIAGINGSMSSALIQRSDNTVLYQSPVMAGWQVGALHSFQFNGDETAPTSANLRLNSGAVKYARGPLYAAITYDRFQNPGVGPVEGHLQAGAAYDFGPVRLHAGYAHETNLYNAALNVSGTRNGAGADVWLLGLTAPLGNGMLRTSWQQRQGERKAGEKRDLRIASIGYEYNLSKRTMLYAWYADSSGKGTLDRNPAYDRRLVTAGLLHRF